MSVGPTPEEIADRYSEASGRVFALVADLSASQAGTTVPGTPRWTVRELLSHLVGGPADMLAGTFEGAGSDEWTQAQVEARRGRSIAELLAEWDAVRPPLDGAIRAAAVPAPVSFDIITHEQDLRGALGAEHTPDPLAVRFVNAGFAARAERVAEKSGLAPLEIRAVDTGWCVGSPGGVSLEASEFELFRALTGRRSGRQVSALGWSGDPAPYLDLLCPFGPLRDTDVSD